MDITAKQFGNNIRMRRCQLNLSGETLSLKSGVTQPQICKIELGLSSPTITTLLKISKTLKIDSYMLLMPDLYGKNIEDLKSGERILLLPGVPL